MAIKRKLKPCKGGCGKEVFYYKDKQCKYCYYKNNPPQWLKKLSERGKKRTADYKQARLEFLETHDVCQVNLPDCLVPYPVEDKSILQIHHKKGRTGDLISNKDYFLCVCHNCHRYIEDHPLWSMENGYSLPRIR